MGRLFLTIGIVLLWIISTPFFPHLILGDLEQKYPAHLLAGDEKLSGVKFIVVLAGGYNETPDIPLISKFSYEGIVRLLEGIRLCRIYDDSKLILSGGSIIEAEMMMKLATRTYSGDLQPF